MAFVEARATSCSGYAGGDRFPAGLATEVRDACSERDVGDLLVGLDRPHPHGRLADIDELDAWQCCFELGPKIEVYLVELDAEPR